MKSKICSCDDLHMLYNKAKQLVNVRSLYDDMLQDNFVTMEDSEIGYPFFKSEFSRKIDFNVSEEYMKAKIYTSVDMTFYSFML